MPTWPMAGAAPWPASRMDSPTSPMSTTPKPAERMWPRLARVYTDSSRCRKSMMTRMPRLKTQLPSTSPMAMFGTFAAVTELRPVTSSGREVTVASRTSPTQLRPSPVFSAMTSP